jgi:hypothetical protein
MKSFMCLIAMLWLVATGCKKGDDIATQVMEELPPDVMQDSTSQVGTFRGAGSYSVTGKVSLLQGADKLVLSFEDFSSSSGPDLKVYLSKDTKASSFINLGELKALKGNFNYEVDKSKYTPDFKYVLIWCEDFSVLFGSAEIKAPAM